MKALKRGISTGKSHHHAEKLRSSEERVRILVEGVTEEPKTYHTKSRNPGRKNLGYRKNQMT